jgi:hypothetical protein
MQNNPNKVVQLHIEVHTDVRVSSPEYASNKPQTMPPPTGQEYEGMEEGISYIAKAGVHGSLSLTIMFLHSTCELCLG